jgi:cell division protein FtsQ
MMYKRKSTYYNEIQRRESRHILLRCIKAFNGMTLAFFILGLVALSGVEVYRWALRASFFQVQKIVLKGNDLLSDETILAFAQIESRCNIFRIEMSGVRRRIGEEHFVRKVDVKRRLPSQVIISIEERKPVAVVEKMSGMIDEDGVFLPLLTHERVSSLPVISGCDAEEGNYGEPLHSEPMRWAVSFLKEIAALGPKAPLEISEIGLDDVHHPLMYVRNWRVPIKIGKSGYRAQLISLPVVLADIERKGIEAEYIDIRYADQIIVKPKTGQNMGLESRAVKG